MRARPASAARSHRAAVILCAIAHVRSAAQVAHSPWDVAWTNVLHCPAHRHSNRPREHVEVRAGILHRRRGHRASTARASCIDGAPAAVAGVDVSVDRAVAQRRLYHRLPRGAPGRPPPLRLRPPADARASVDTWSRCPGPALERERERETFP